MKKLFEIETDKIEILEKFRELARKYEVKFQEWKLEKKENPSPSGDSYFENPKNIEKILEGAKQVQEGNVVKMSREQRKKMLGL